MPHTPASGPLHLLCPLPGMFFPTASPPVAPSHLLYNSSPAPHCYVLPSTAVICAPYNGGSGEQGFRLSHARLSPREQGCLSSHWGSGAFCSDPAVPRCSSSINPPLPPLGSWLLSGQILPKRRVGVQQPQNRPAPWAQSLGFHGPSLAHTLTPEPIALATGAGGTPAKQVSDHTLPGARMGPGPRPPEDNCNTGTIPRGPRVGQANQQ